MKEPYFIFYQSAMLLSLLGSLFVMVMTWRCRRAPGAKAMIALTVSTFIWTLGFLLEANSGTLEQQLFFNNVGYIGSMSVPVAWFIFALHYTSANRLVTGWRILPFCVIPLITVVLVWSNNWHHLMWSNEHLVESGPFTITVKTYGTFFWIAFAHSYILVITGAVILIRRLFVGASLYMGQAISLIVAVSLPLIWNFIYVFNLVPLPRKDLTPVMFAISGIAIAFGLMRFQLFKVVPFARKFLIQQLNDGILVFDMNNRLLEANPAGLIVLGANKNIIGKRIECLSPSSTVLGRVSSTRFGSVELPLTISGEERFYELETVPMLDNHKHQVGWLAILHDITERKRQELEYKTIIQTTVDGFWLTDTKGQFLDVNDAYCQLIGYSRAELLKMDISDIEAVEKSEETAARITMIKKIGKDRFETRHRRKDGGIIDVEVSVNYIEVGDGRLFVFIRDITERKKMQEQLIVQDRLASIGELTSGIAHEISNPLATVIGYADWLLKRDIPDEIRKELEAINRGAERAGNILDRLLTFAGQRGIERDYVDINQILEITIEFRNHSLLSSNIEVTKQFDDDLPKIWGDGGQLQDVFLNLIMNAEYSMREANGQGKLTITTERTDSNIYVSFKDDGVGISKENISKIFEPFFTTKPVGKGTGLGLSICHRIITTHGGRIYAESEFGRGATFIIELPIIITNEQEG